MSLRLLLLLLYPPLAHLAVISRSRTLTAAALILLGVVTLYTSLRSGRPRAWLSLALCAAIASLLAATGGGLWLMVTLSLALPGAVLAGFVSSLRSGHTPMITTIAMRMQNPLPQRLYAYTRWLTVFWAAMIATLMAIELALILFSTPTDWSRYANGYAYPIIVAIFAAEYLYRRWRFRHLPQPGLVAYLRGLLTPQVTAGPQA